MTITDPKTIARIPLAHVDDIAEQLRADVLERARQQFGYKADTLAHQGPLGTALRELEIAPLNEADVRLYMQSKERTWKGWKAWAQFVAPLSMPVLWLFVYFAGCRRFALPLLPWHDGATGTQDFWSFEGLLISILVGIGLGCGMEKWLPDMIYRRTWRTWFFGKPEHEWVSAEGWRQPYQRFIPVHALEIALQVQALVPEALFRIHELTLQVQEVTKPLPDPFLSVTLGSEEYFIAVWDERDFEVRA